MKISKYEPGFSYRDNRGAKITLLEWIKIDHSLMNDKYRWRIKCELLGIETLAWTDDCWIDLYTGKAFLNEQTHQITYYDDVVIIPKKNFEELKQIFNVQLTKADFINLVKSVRPKTMEECSALTIIGLMKFTGNQHNEAWDWEEMVLNEMTEKRLWNIYNLHK